MNTVSFLTKKIHLKRIGNFSLILVLIISCKKPLTEVVAPPFDALDEYVLSLPPNPEWIGPGLGGTITDFRSYTDAKFLLDKDSFFIITKSPTFMSRNTLTFRCVTTVFRSKRLKQTARKVLPKKRNAILKGSFTNFIENERENKRIGDLGELLVLECEQERLKTLGIAKEPKHVSKTQGDGYGYDILSYNDKGEEIYIEVKTTTYGSDTPFYITANELEKSVESNSSYFLYRVYDYDDDSDSAKYFMQQGNLQELCCNPVMYKVYLA